MANKKVVVLPGDDAAPEAMAATMDVLRALELPIDFIEFPPGEKWVRGETYKQARAAIDASDTTNALEVTGRRLLQHLVAVIRIAAVRRQTGFAA